MSAPTGKTKNKTPYQFLIDIAQGIMMLITVLAVLAMIFWKSIVYAGYAQAVSAIIGILGTVLIGLGAAILAMSGDKMMGGIVTLIGAFTVGSAFLPVVLTEYSIVINQAAGALISNVVGMMATSMQKMRTAAME